jgi:hypothetical protein
MPFTFEALETTPDGDELVLRGRVVSGAYFGPESAVVRFADGEEISTHIHSHRMEYPEGWPVIPEHRKTVLILRIPLPAHEFKIGTLIGLGAISRARERIDISHVLEEPKFWAIQFDLHYMSEEVEKPGQEWLGVAQRDAEDWYEAQIQEPINQGVWPYIRVLLPSSRYIEFEMAGGIEPQDRIWIGNLAGDQRVLLGYHSGHFSLPALRSEEVSYLAESTHSEPANLLWLTAACLEDGTHPLALATRLASRVPGLLKGKDVIVAEALLQRMAVNGLAWVNDPACGWINNSAHSQRNPESHLCTLKQGDFEYIRQFFV